MKEQLCPYCQSEIRPLDTHAREVKPSRVRHEKEPRAEVELIEVTCVLVRIVTAKIGQVK